MTKHDETEDDAIGESPWPRDGDRLFIESVWAHDAYIVRNPRERAYRLPMGYKRAGDILLDQAATDVADRSNVVYAALFCYRQSLELYLKTLIDRFGSELTHKTKYTHNPRDLWQQFLWIMRERGQEETIGLVAAEGLIAEMDEADRKSDGFRFPADRHDAPFAFGDRGIDIANLRKVMVGLENFLECAYLAFAHQDDESWVGGA